MSINAELISMPFSGEPLICDRFEDYCLACALPSLRHIPVIEDQTRWPLEKLNAFNAGSAHTSLRFESRSFDERRAFRDRWSSFSWRQRCLEVINASPAHQRSSDIEPALTRGETRILVGDNPSAISGALIGRLLGLPLRVAEGSLIEASLDELRTKAGTVVIVALVEELTDTFLFGLLDELQSALDSEMLWEKLPRFTLLVGRDLAGLSWQAAKILSARLRPDLQSPNYHLSHYSPSGDLTIRRQRHINRVEGASDDTLIAQESLDGIRFKESLIAPADAIVIDCHGFDSCARGAGGVVLCGLRSEDLRLEGGTSGALGCGRGYVCPRGPYPLPLKYLQAQTLMLATCNGLRLANGVLTPDFNLALTFLDGIGATYVSSALASMGSHVCSVAFAAALASGHTAVEATTLVNGLLHCAGIERTVYFALGMPDCLPESKPAAIERAPDSTLSFESDYIANPFCRFSLDDPETILLAREARLAMAISSSTPGENIFWFHRLESGESEHSSGSQRVSVWVFRFPESLGRLTLSLIDTAQLKDQANASINGFRRWTELWRLAGIDKSESENLRMLCEGEREARHLLCEFLARLSFDGMAFKLAQQQIEMIDNLAVVARDIVLEHILPQLSGTLWPTNLLIPEYYFDGSGTSTCPTCGGAAIRKTIRHALREEGRIVDVCPRCGIVSDALEYGCIKAVRIAAPDTARAGERFEIKVSIELSKRAETPPAIIFARVCRSGPWSPQAPPTPEPSEWAMDKLSGEPVLFSFQLPPDHIPHHYYIKALVVSCREFAFASRVFFIC